MIICLLINSLYLTNPSSLDKLRITLASLIRNQSVEDEEQIAQDGGAFNITIVGANTR